MNLPGWTSNYFYQFESLLFRGCYQVNEEIIVLDFPTANWQELETAEPFHLLKFK